MYHESSHSTASFCAGSGVLGFSFPVSNSAYLLAASQLAGSPELSVGSEAAAVQAHTDGPLSYDLLARYEQFGYSALLVITLLLCFFYVAKHYTRYVSQRLSALEAARDRDFDRYAALARDCHNAIKDNNEALNLLSQRISALNDVITRMISSNKGFSSGGCPN